VRESTLLSLPSTVQRDTGYQRGFTHAYNGASRCANRAAGAGGAVRLGPTAMAGAVAYVTESGAIGAGTQIVAIAHG
jgi:hypothetical protein